MQYIFQGITTLIYPNKKLLLQGTYFHYSFLKLIKKFTSFFREHLWNQLNNFKTKEHNLNLVDYTYIDLQQSYKDTVLPLLKNIEQDPLFFKKNQIKSCSSKDMEKENIYLTNCIIPSALKIGQNSVLSGIQIDESTKEDIELGSGMVWQCWPQKNSSSIITCHGLNDCIYSLFTESSFFNQPPELIFQSGLSPNDIWNLDETRCFINAKIFLESDSITNQLKHIQNLVSGSITSEIINKPCKSLAQVIKNCDLNAVVEQEFKMLLKTSESAIKKTANDPHVALNSLLKCISSSK